MDYQKLTQGEIKQALDLFLNESLERRADKKVFAAVYG